MARRYGLTLSGALRWILALSALAYLLLFLYLALRRLGYPYELEWMEGGTVDHVRRILSGQRLYVEPSIEFTPFIYTPLYFYTAALLAKVFGVSFFALRLVSFLSSIGCFVIIFQFVRRETRSLLCATVSACLYAATYRLTGTWFDLARVDSLFMFFLLGSVYVLRFKQGSAWLAVAGIFISLSFLTKQAALLAAVPLSVYCLVGLRGWSRVVYPGAVALVVGLTTIVFDSLSDDWYRYYVFELPRQHAIVREMIVGFWMNDLAKPLPVALGVSVFYLIGLRRREKRGDLLFFIFLLAGMVGASWFSRLHSGGYRNVVLPAYAVIAICFGLGIRGFVKEAAGASSDPGGAAAAPHDTPTGLAFEPYRQLVLVLCVFQFVALFYNPQAQLPSKADLIAGRFFVQKLEKIEGEVFVPYHGFLPALAGKRTYAHGMAIEDVLRGSDGEVKDKLRENIADAIRSKRFAAIILDRPWFIEEIEQAYVLTRRLFRDRRVFYPVTGRSTRPNMVYELAEAGT